MAADRADLQPLFTLSRVAANRQLFEAAVTATAQSDPAANISQGDLISFDEGGATHEALPPVDCPVEGARHITPSPLPECAESREPQRHTGSTQSAPVPDLTGQSESPQVEGARHITPSPLPECAESREPQRHTGSTQSAPCARPYWPERVSTGFKGCLAPD
ncbi:hypothetical protein MTO96_035164 [Rhipicephalus appendiculatus]